MNLFPQSSGRPRTACEITPEAVVAARSEVASGPLSTAARISLPAEAVLPSLKPGNLIDRVAVIAAVRRALEGVGLRPNSRGSDLTLIIPDAATRVLLLDFDSLPTKLTEALPVVRFRLKKLLPFEAEDAMVSYQVMSSTRNLVRVLAVAVPRDVLREYETAVREAGFEPGAVLPSTLAALPDIPAGEPALLINSHPQGVTTAILDREVLLLHRTVDLQSGPTAVPATIPPPAYQDVNPRSGTTASEPARADAGYGFNEYADRRATEEAVQSYDGITGLPLTSGFGQVEPVSPTMYVPQQAAGSTEDAHSILISENSMRSLAGSEADLTFLAAAALGVQSFDPNDTGPLEEEIAQAVSVAMAYFEDTLSSEPRLLWSSGSMPADTVAQLLHRHGLVRATGLEVRELVSASLLEGSVISATVPPHALAGVVGALRG